MAQSRHAGMGPASGGGDGKRKKGERGGPKHLPGLLNATLVASHPEVRALSHTAQVGLCILITLRSQRDHFAISSRSHRAWIAVTSRPFAVEALERSD